MAWGLGVLVFLRAQGCGCMVSCLGLRADDFKGLCRVLRGSAGLMSPALNLNRIFTEKGRTRHCGHSCQTCMYLGSISDCVLCLEF